MMVTAAMSAASAPAPMNHSGPRSIRAEKPFNQSRISHQASGHAAQFPVCQGLQQLQLALARHAPEVGLLRGGRLQGVTYPCQPPG